MDNDAQNSRFVFIKMIIIHKNVDERQESLKYWLAGKNWKNIFARKIQIYCIIKVCVLFIRSTFKNFSNHYKRLWSSFLDFFCSGKQKTNKHLRNFHKESLDWLKNYVQRQINQSCLTKSKKNVVINIIKHRKRQK